MSVASGGRYTVNSYCRFCATFCGVTVTVDDGELSRIAGDRDHPLSHGYVCPKGRKMVAVRDDPALLDRPMLRNSRGELTPVGWDTALDDLGERLVDVRDRFGPYAIATYSGTNFDSAGKWACTRFMQAIGSPSSYSSLTIDSIAKVLVPQLMAGRSLSPTLDRERTTLLIVIGENMVVSHGGYSYFPDPIGCLRTIARRGEVWVLDPRRTETAHHATRHLMPRSGSDFAVLAHVVRELMHDGADHAYLRDHARHVEQLREAVARFDVTTTVGLTGLRSEDLADLVAAVRRHEQVAIVTGTGVTMANTGNVTEWLAFALQIVTHSFERPGGRSFNHGAATWPATGTAAPAAALQPGSRTRPDIPRLADQYPCSVLPSEIEQGHLHALLLMGGNPLTSFPQPGRLADAMKKLSVVAAWDIFRGATLEQATHVFPCPTPLERADLAIPLHVSLTYAQFSPAVVAPRGDRRPMWWSIAHVARRLGCSILPGDADPDECPEDSVFAAMAAGVPVPFAQLRDADGPVAFEPEERWVERFVLPDGRWDVAPPRLVERLEHATSRALPELALGNRRQVHHVNSTLTWGVGTDEPLESCVYVNPVDARSAGVNDGERVEVSSAHGSVNGVCRIDEGLARGTVTIPHGFAAPNVGNLVAIDEDVDPLTGMPMLVGVPVELRPATAG